MESKNHSNTNSTMLENLSQAESIARLKYFTKGFKSIIRDIKLTKPEEFDYQKYRELFLNLSNFDINKEKLELIIDDACVNLVKIYGYKEFTQAQHKAD